MAFVFQWPVFEEALIERMRLSIETALNAQLLPAASAPASPGASRSSTPQPHGPIVAPIRVTRFDPGHEPPSLDLLELGELSREAFRGILRLQYNGDAVLSLSTQVQVNPIHSLDPLASDPARAPLIVPMELQISHLRLNALFSLIYSATRGLTLSFKNEPLDSVQVSSSFDGMGPVRSFLQREIEQRLAQAIRTELPRLLHQHSQAFVSRREERRPSNVTHQPASNSLYYEVQRGVLQRTPSALGFSETDASLPASPGLASLMRTQSQARFYQSHSPLRHSSSLLRLLQKPDEGLASLMRKPPQ